MVSQSTPPSKPSVSPVLVIILGMLFLLTAIVVGAVIFYKNCPTCQEFVQGITEGTTAIIDGMNAPGTAEMRALGCDQAMSIDMEVFENMFAPIAGEDEILDENMRSMKMLICQLEGIKHQQAPGCPDVVRAWVSGAGQQEQNEVFVVVQGQNRRDNYCQGIYSMDGTLVSDLEGTF